jgi:O-antigen ligase
MLSELHTRVSEWRNGLNERSAVHTMALALVWLAMATSGFVFSEPCPTDVLTLALMVLLPVIGLVTVGPVLGLLMMTWIASGAFGLLSSMAAFDFTKAVTHTGVSIYLYGATIVFAGFIASKPEQHLRLIFSGLTVAALIACATGLIGYFGLVPGADMFTKFGRATGTFKDPNVFGPFLVPALLYAVHRALERPLSRSLAPLAIAGFLALGVFMSFSRGAWINLVVAHGVFLLLSFLTAADTARRLKIAFLGVFSAALVAMIVAGALQIESVANLVSERASVAQSYDVGPEGRFGGQEKAVGLILENPMGIGAGQFALVHHHEEVHNVYLSMTLNAGWIGAGLYTIAVLATLGIGLYSAMTRRCGAHAYLLIATAAFAANAFEGIVIDTDHWRHFYLLMAMVWGISTAPSRAIQTRPVLKGRHATAAVA